MRLALQPQYIRWNVCAQEFCFQHNAALEAFFGAGHTIPIFRGGGVDQEYLLQFARQAAAGRWLHIFPEGGVYQTDELGGRYYDGRAISRRKTSSSNGEAGGSTRGGGLGKLKWGVGKLIAHAPAPPVVIPFHHRGMERMMPVDPVTRKGTSVVPRLPSQVEVWFGPEISFDDLIAEHEAQYGPLWRYCEEDDDNIDNGEQIDSTNDSINKRNVAGLTSKTSSRWLSLPTDFLLYHRIASRIEAALTALNDRALAETEAQTEAEASEARKRVGGES
jgi:monolysocardiolipin acyltransferase